MNITFLMQDIGAMYGAERATVDLVTRLQRNGEHVHVLLIDEERLGLERSDLRDALAASGISFRRLRTGHAFSPMLVRRIRDAASEVRARVVHTIGPKATFHGFFAIRNSDIRLVSTVHGWLFRKDLKERMYEWLEQKILKRFDRVIVLSSYYRDYLIEEGFRHEQVVYIPSGLDAESVVTLDEARRAPTSPETFTVGTIGRLSAEKNLEMFLRAAQIVLNHGIKAAFLIAGKGPERSRLEQRIEEWGLGGSVRLPGYLPVGQFMRQVHVLVQCSRIENLPYSVMEAMAWCRPVIATRVGGMPDLVDDGRTGFLVSDSDAGALASRIQQLAGNSAQCRAMGEAGRMKLETEFSPSRQIERHLQVYSDGNRR